MFKKNYKERTVTGNRVLESPEGSHSTGTCSLESHGYGMQHWKSVSDQYSVVSVVLDNT